jgi:two-component system NtrC family sensor kinase
MTLQLTLVTAAALANLVLGLIVLSRNPSGPVHRHFAFFTLSVAVWTLSSTFVLVHYHSPLVARLPFAAASAIPLAFLLFTSVFPTSTPPPPRPAFTIAIAIGLLSVFLSFTPLILDSAIVVDGAVQAVYGPLYPAFCIYFTFCLGFSLHLLTRKMRSLTGLQKLQVRYLFLGVLLSAIGATITNLAVPLLFATSRLSRYGPLFGLPMSAMIAHAIVRYRLMNIRIVIRKSVVYLCAITAAASILVILLTLLASLAGYPKHTIPLIQALLIALLVAILFHPLKGIIERSFNRYLYRETYNYQRTLRDLSRRLSSMLELEPLLEHLTAFIEDTFKAESVTLYLQNSPGKGFAPRHSSQTQRWRSSAPSTPLPETSPVVGCLMQQHKSLVREEAIRSSPDKHLHLAAEELRLLEADIALPLKDRQTMIGVVTVGPKRSGDPYFAEDIDLLETLVGQAGVTMRNAQLYSQVVLVNEYVDNILSTMDSGVIAIAPDGVISLFNAAAERLTGMRRTTAQGTQYRLLPSALAIPLHDALTNHTSRSQFETSIDDSDGATTPLVCSTAILTHKGSSAHGALIVFSDLTRLKELEHEKRRAERLASFGALASGVAHEIKNPLVAIRTFAELLPDRFADVDFREDFAKVVTREIDRIDDLVGRLRGIAGTAPQQVGIIDVREPITDTLRLLRAQLEQTRITATCDFIDRQPYVAVEEAQLKQLFLNVFLNAIEAMGQGGDLYVQVHRRSLSDRSWVSVSVSDTGPGIPESIHASMFEPFFTTKSRGSGLGLAICRAIADANHGTIRAENKADGPGATVVIELPAAQDPALVAQDPAMLANVGVSAFQMSSPTQTK